MANNPTFFFILDNIFQRKTVTPAQARKLLKDSSEKELEPLYNPNPTPIYIGTTIRGRFIKVHTGLKVRPIEWDFNLKEYKKRKHSDWYENNNYLSSRISEIRRRFLNLRMECDDINPEQVKQLMIQVIKGNTAEVKVIDFFKVFDLFLEDKKKISKPGTLQKYTILKGHLLTFQKSYYKLTFEKMTKQFDADFKYWSINEKKHLNNSIARNVKCIKVFLKWGHEQKWHSNLEYEKFKVTNDESNIMALTYEELMSICNLDLSDKSMHRLDKVRDIFVFQCMTGQRYSDIANLKFKDIRKTSDGLTWFVYQIKGNKREGLPIPLLDRAVAILNKYQHGKELQANDTILPVISLTNMNLYLKEIGKLAKLTALENRVNFSGIKRIEKSASKMDLLSTHTARRTFVTLSLQMGMRREIVQSITGHKDAKVMAKYIAISDSMQKSEFKDVWNEKI